MVLATRASASLRTRRGSQVAATARSRRHWQQVEYLARGSSPSRPHLRQRQDLLESRGVQGCTDPTLKMTRGVKPKVVAGVRASGHRTQSSRRPATRASGGASVTRSAKIGESVTDAGAPGVTRALSPRVGRKDAALHVPPRQRGGAASGAGREAVSQPLRPIGAWKKAGAQDRLEASFLRARRPYAPGI